MWSCGRAVEASTGCTVAWVSWRPLEALGESCSLICLQHHQGSAAPKEDGGVDQQLVVRSAGAPQGTVLSLVLVPHWTSDASLIRTTCRSPLMPPPEETEQGSSEDLLWWPSSVLCIHVLGGCGIRWIVGYLACLGRAK